MTERHLVGPSGQADGYDNGDERTAKGAITRAYLEPPRCPLGTHGSDLHYSRCSRIRSDGTLVPHARAHRSCRRFRRIPGPGGTLTELPLRAPEGSGCGAFGLILMMVFYSADNHLLFIAACRA